MDEYLEVAARPFQILGSGKFGKLECLENMRALLALLMALVDGQH